MNSSRSKTFSQTSGRQYVHDRRRNVLCARVVFTTEQCRRAGKTRGKNDVYMKNKTVRSPSVRAYVRRLDKSTPVRFVRERCHSKSEKLRCGGGGGIVKRPLQYCALDGDDSFDVSPGRRSGCVGTMAPRRAITRLLVLNTRYGDARFSPYPKVVYSVSFVESFPIEPT